MTAVAQILAGEIIQTYALFDLQELQLKNVIDFDILNLMIKANFDCGKQLPFDAKKFMKNAHTIF